MEEKELNIERYRNIDEVIKALVAEREKGNHVFCNFNGHILHSDTATVDSIYMEVIGMTKEAYLQEMKAWREKYEIEEQQRKAREEGYAKKVAESRAKGRGPITQVEVINGLKFIAENQQLTQDELIDGLLDMGCNFTLDDINKQFRSTTLLFDGMVNGDISCGATVIANMRDSEYGRDFAIDRFLSVDRDESIYHYIRVTTGDQSYTLENIKSRNNGNGNHK